MAVNGVNLLEHLQTPALVVSQGQVDFANTAAKLLLGGHIVGQDVRIAIRNPDAVAVIMGEAGGTAQVDGLSVGGSVWEVDCHVLGAGDRLVSLYDQSVQVSVARAHADFVANASHELRTPLAAMLGYVETLIDPKAGGDAATRETIPRHHPPRGAAHAGAGRGPDVAVADRGGQARGAAGEVEIVALARETAGEFRDGAKWSRSPANETRADRRRPRADGAGAAQSHRQRRQVRASPAVR